MFRNVDFSDDFLKQINDILNEDEKDFGSQAYAGQDPATANAERKAMQRIDPDTPGKHPGLPDQQKLSDVDEDDEEEKDDKGEKEKGKEVGKDSTPPVKDANRSDNVREELVWSQSERKYVVVEKYDDLKGMAPGIPTSGYFITRGAPGSYSKDIVLGSFKDRGSAEAAASRENKSTRFPITVWKTSPSTGDRVVNVVEDLEGTEGDLGGHGTLPNDEQGSSDIREPLAKGDVSGKDFQEAAPPGMEDEIKKMKPKFKQQYGDDWEEKLYATAWKMYKDKKESVEEDRVRVRRGNDGETQIEPIDDKQEGSSEDFPSKNKEPGIPVNQPNNPEIDQLDRGEKEPFTGNGFTDPILGGQGTDGQNKGEREFHDSGKKMNDPMVEQVISVLSSGQDLQEEVGGLNATY